MATAQFPRGSILVKNNLGPDGEPLGVLTVLAKFEAGYYPGGKDWFFAMITSDGEVLNDTVGNGAEIYFCYDCHAQLASNTDLVVGVLPDQLR